MTSMNRIGVSFREFDDLGNCYADIILPISGSEIRGFKVRKGFSGGIMVHMPSGMRTIWTYDEIEWAEVRKQVTEEYLRMGSDLPISVKLHHFDEKNNCLADITLRDSGVVISDFKVMPGASGGVMVHMPPWMHTRWSYTEVQWSEVRRIVAEEYLSSVAGKERSAASYTASDGTFFCNFYSSVTRTEAIAEATVVSSNEQICGIPLMCSNDKNTIQVFMPKEKDHCWDVTCIEWDQLVESIIYEFRRQILGECESSESVSQTVRIEFHNIREVTVCMADIKLPHKKNIIKGFRIKKSLSDNKTIVSVPKWMKRWNDSRLSWDDLRTLIIREYNRFAEAGDKDSENSGSGFEPAAVPTVSGDSVVSENEDSVKNVSGQSNKDKDELGRVKNAENSSFIFYPRTVLRSVDYPACKDSDSGKKLYALVNALNKGALGGIGPFEINILEWIAKLRYVTSTMLLDLIKAGYVSYGWRSDVTQIKLAKIISRMAYYDLISLTRFMTVNEDGSLDSSHYSIMRIITLGRNGGILLRELGKKTPKYNAFDIFQDGNTVKRSLTSNQWLVYWLQTCQDEIGDEYETSCVIHLKGVDYVGARLYATVTVNDRTMVAEPVRRVEEFEIEKNKQDLRDKIERLALMFDNLDQLYHGNYEISFSRRPIIVLICEDDDHILEIWEAVKPILPQISQQEIWFSSDLRVFNYNKRGERFLRFVNDQPQPVDLKQALGVDDLEETGTA